MSQIRLSVLHRLIITTIIIAAIIFCAVAGLTHVAVQSGMKQMEQTAAGDSFDHLLLVIDAEKASIQRTAYDWGVWNETWEYMRGENPDFIEKNLNGKVLNAADITWLLFYNATGTLMYGAGLDEKNKIIQVSPDEINQGILADHLIGPSGITDTKGGLFYAGGEVFLLGIQPVLRGDESGPASGSVVAVRKFDDESISKKSISLPASVRISAFRPGDDPYTDLNLGIGKTHAEFIESDSMIITQTLLPDLLNRPSFLVTMKIPFQTPYGSHLILLILLIILTGLGLFTAAIYYGFTRLFMRYVNEIGQGLNKAATTGRQEQSFLVDLPPDLTSLAGSAKRIMTTLEDKEVAILRSEHARKTVEIRWEILFQSAAEGILIGDEEGVLICNPRFELLTGFSGEELVGIAIADLPFISTIGNGIRTLQDIWNGGGSEGERFIWTITPRDAETCCVRILDANLRFVEMNGRILRFLITRDITNEMRLHHEQEQAIRQIDKNLGQLAALNDEIRNPLTMVAAWTELDNPPNREKIMDGVKRINEIINRIDTGYIESEKVRKYLQKSIDGYRKDTFSSDQNND